MVHPEPRAAAPEVEPVVEAEAPLPPPSPHQEGGEARAEGVGPQVGQGPAGIDLVALIQAIAEAFQAVVVGGQAVEQPQGEGTGLRLERLRSLGGEEF
ncbi:hypothetical protein HRI_004059200 [Hibiscus trionum]|uniref:Uncharacterized protein n=1 Tax=Hibiscus trionum TaxID=183268 RepID=A0A9W7IXT8_HIBTR|nr:hypothetical protein HRI_004059200 [Hibiscus trionum]